MDHNDNPTSAWLTPDLVVDLKHLEAVLAGLDSLDEGLNAILRTLTKCHGSDAGNVQLFVPGSGKLMIRVHCGFQAEFLDFFREVGVYGDTACGRALRNVAQVVIADVEREPSFEPYRAIVRRANIRAVQSTPIMGSSGEVIGMISTHFKRPHRLTDIDLTVAKKCADIARQFIAEVATANVG